MADRILTATDKQGRVTPSRLLTATRVYLKQQTIAVHGLHGKEKLTKAVEMLSTVMAINDLIEIYNIELKGLIGLRAIPWTEEENVKDMKAIGERINEQEVSA